jgi:hypothetical protein
MEAETAQLDDLRNAAHALGMAFARAAEAESDLDRKLSFFDAFHRSFASVRLSIALALRLKREAHRPARIETERPEPLDVERAEAPERPERYDERDRDREAERASFPLLLRTLGRVADDAQALLPQAAELPTLRELLDRVGAQPAAAAAPVTTPLRSRLSGGTATLTLSPPPRLGALAGVPPRRSTGPPRR